MTYTPAIVRSVLNRYKLNDFIGDLISGIMVGIVAIPMAIAFAIASGVSPAQGLYTSIIAGFIIGLFGGSRFQISGPTGAFVVVVLSIVHQYGYMGLAVATIMAGVMLILLGLFRLGSLVKYMPRPVIIGFTSGIALIIFSTQIGNLLGITIHPHSDSFIESYKQYFLHISELNIYALVISLITIFLTVFLSIFTKKIPSSLIAIIFSSIICYLFHLPVETIGTKFGSIPATLPHPQIPYFDFSMLQEMLPSAFTIALLGAVESLLSATVADGMTKTQHNSNAELIGQGIGNIISPIFQGIPATGGIVRTAANIRFGGRTPFAAIIHSVTLVLVMFFFSKYVLLIPLGALAGILVVVSWNMSEIHTFKKTLKTTKFDVLVLISTFLLTVLTNLTTAIEIGLIVSALSVIQRMSATSSFTLHKIEELGFSIKEISDKHPIEVIQLKGSLFFGSVDKFRSLVNKIKNENEGNKTIIFDMQYTAFVDASGIHELENVYNEFKKIGINFFICHLNMQVTKAIYKSHMQYLIKNTNNNKF